jgi:hypothetical protein
MVYVFSPEGDVQEYDPAADIWTVKARYPRRTSVGDMSEKMNWYHQTAGWVQVGGKIYVIGGYVTDPLRPRM